MKDTVDNLTIQHTNNRFNQAVKHTFLSLRNRNFRLFFIGQMISNTGNWLTNIAITLLVLNLTHSGLAVGLLAACQYGPILFLSAWAGAIADDMNKRNLLLVTQTLEMGQSIALAIIAFTPNPSIPALFVVALAGGVFLAFDNPLRRSFVSEMVRPEDLPNAVVLYSTIVNVSRAFGPALAGLLVVTLGYGWAFTFLYTIFSVGAVVSSLIVANRGFVHMRHILYGAAALGVTMFLLAFSPTIAIAIPAMFLVGLASILYMTATTTLAQVESKREMHGRVLALQTVLLIGPTAIGGPILGWISDTLGAQAPLIIGAITCLLVAAWGYYVTHQPQSQSTLPSP